MSITNLFESEEQAREFWQKLIEPDCRKLRTCTSEIECIDCDIKAWKQAGAIRKSAAEIAFDELMEYVNEMSEVAGYKRYLKPLILNYKVAMEEKK